MMMMMMMIIIIIITIIIIIIIFIIIYYYYHHTYLACMFCFPNSDHVTQFSKVSYYHVVWNGKTHQTSWKECLVKVKKTTAKTVYEQSCTTSDPKRSWSVKIYKIELRVTVKKTFAGTDQTTWNRVKLRYFDWPIPVFIRFTEISRIYRNIYNIWSKIMTGNYIIWRGMVRLLKKTR